MQTSTAMWHFISDQISQQIDYDFVCDDIREISSSDSHKAYRISDGRKRYFVKINQKSKLSHFEAESEGLCHLQQAEKVRVPRVICSGVASDASFLALEHILLQDGNAEDWQLLGNQLASLHQQQSQQMYGWQEDNYIGLTLQSNRWEKKWSTFFAEQRIGFQLQLLHEKGHQLADIDKAVGAVKRLLAGHQPQASMLHGDLWSGNVGFHKHQPVIFDPAFYYGDRETDIAMTELFGRFPQSFYEGYESVWPLDDSYLFRKPIYQLYHTLNHALMFEGHYLQAAKSTLNNLDN